MPESPADRDGNALNEWLAETLEPALDPDRAIIDPHHHLWDRRRAGDYKEATPTHRRYLGDELIDDILRSGHRVVDTVFVECLAMYRADESPFASCGEVEFVQGVAAMSASGGFGQTSIAAAIVGTADDVVEEILRQAIASGVNYFLCRFAFGDMTYDEAKQSVDRFTSVPNVQSG